MVRRQIDGLFIVSIFFILFIGYKVVRDRYGVLAVSASQGNAAGIVAVSVALQNDPGVRAQPDFSQHPVPDLPIPEFDPNLILPPYAEYQVTQGPHGAEYGHMAIDISAGKGAVIKSPIHGFVAALFFDPVGSTILVLENERWQVTLVHGLFTVSEGDAVALGQPIGSESNQGNTFDFQGRSCRGRDCGYHTHINILDKQTGANINPLDLFP